ncbi:MAG: hypothetical protein ACI4UH_07635 [Dorea sp.]
METKFKVIMKKDKKVLEDFIVFSQRVKNPSIKSKMSIIAVGFFIIGIFAYKDSEMTGIIIGALGAFLLVYALFKDKLATRRLAKIDPSYKEQNELMYEFTNGNIYIYKDGELETNVGSYSRVSCLYSDEFNIYVGINNEDLLLLPRKCFVVGDHEEFVPFVEGKSKEQSIFLPRTIENRWKMYKIRRKARDAEFNAKAAQRREADKKKKEERKAKKSK